MPFRLIWKHCENAPKSKKFPLIIPDGSLPEESKTEKKNNETYTYIQSSWLMNKENRNAFKDFEEVGIIYEIFIEIQLNRNFFTYVQMPTLQNYRFHFQSYSIPSNTRDFLSNCVVILFR